MPHVMENHKIKIFKKVLTQCSMKRSRILEKSIATASFVTAAALAFTALLLNGNADINTGAIYTCAQFLTLTATILGVDYKFNSKE